MLSRNRLSLATLAAPLAMALAIAGCDSTEEGAAALESEAVAEVPPPEGSAWAQQVQRTEDGGWLVGNPDAPIKLVEYGSLTCPGCAVFSATASESLMNEYVSTGRVSFELRSFMIHGVQDLVLTRLIECAPETAAVPLADQIWITLARDRQYVFDTSNGPALEQANSLPPDQRLAALAEVSGALDWFAARGVSRSQGQACLNDIDAAQNLAEVTQASAAELGVNGTPTFFLNGQELPETSWESVEAALQRAGAR